MEIFDIVDQLINKNKVEFIFINSTPWWGGNEFGYTFGDEGNVTVPSANTIVGKTRWLMRNIIVQILGLNSFDGIDERFLKDLGTLNSRSKIAVRVTRCEGNANPSYYFSKNEASYIFKTAKLLENWPTIKNKQRAISSKNLIRESIGNKIDIIKNIMNFTQDDNEKIKNKYSKEGIFNNYNSIFQEHKSSLEVALCYLSESAKEYFRYFLIPRFILAHIRVDSPEEYYYMQPAKPKSVKIKVEVINNGADEDFFNFFVTSLIFTMKYMGIGKAATRGFGRFILTDQQTSDFQTEFNSLLKIGTQLVCKEACKPNFDIPIIRIDNPQIFFFKVKRFEKITGKDPITYLIAIGNATLKVAWKIAIKKNYKDKGAAYHTWTLGLPRSQHKTGYLIDEEEGRRISYITISPICDGNTCDKIYLIPFIYEEKEEFKKLRYKGGHDRQPKSIYNKAITPDKKEYPVNAVRDHVYIALSWLRYILSGGDNAS
ncbi:hypothetical protein [Acidianus brierleyi]|uniref:hypothetical protein n=1 Tax=Acidianus brierleyi TaxID=41673 RepID=UPI001FEC23FC|nr:hypothetical protein [Acidianus brierleyi]